MMNNASAASDPGAVVNFSFQVSNLFELIQFESNSLKFY